VIKIVEATNEIHFQDIRSLLTTYAEMRNYDAALGDFKKELSELPSFYGPPEGALLIAYYNGRAAGCVAYRKMENGICEMKRMYVDENFRGKGIGYALANKIVETAVDSKYKMMRLDTHPWMDSAMNIYKKIGFVETEAYHYNPTKGIRFFELNLVK
jgi:GNAT superfamily N-acetyltransferase